MTKQQLAQFALDLMRHLDYCGWGDSWERECAEQLRREAEEKQPELEKLAKKGNQP